ncbi:MAG TPA: sigma-70 family RNA polymerase sigma factor [Terracidiphilus sp.]|jgi:RNA polymerase sigma-70 factor (ECF subfamily)|nr:sigma-70 family RNA polymerase sigma factor [Terracidiphilus sp.]
MTEDQKLVRLCMRGNEEAWAQFVAGHEKLIFGICYRFAGPDEDLDDLAQEALIKIWSNLRSYSPARGTLNKWVAAVTRNACVDRYRKNGKQRRTESIDASLEHSDSIAFGHFVDSGPTPHDIAAANELAEIVLHHAEKISPEMWTVVRMRFLHELDNGEIAKKLRIPEGTVKSRINRGRAQLTALLRPVQMALGAA